MNKQGFRSLHFHLFIWEYDRMGIQPKEPTFPTFFWHFRYVLSLFYSRKYRNVSHLFVFLLVNLCASSFRFVVSYAPPFTLSQASSIKALKISNSNENILLHSSQFFFGVGFSFRFSFYVSPSIMHSVLLLLMFWLLSLRANSFSPYIETRKFQSVCLHFSLNICAWRYA